MAYKTEVSKDDIVEMYLSGKSLAIISDDTGAPGSRVRHVLLKRGIKMRTRGGKERETDSNVHSNLSPMELFATLAIFAYGKTASQAGEWLDIPRSTAGEAARRGARKLRARGLPNA